MNKFSPENPDGLGIQAQHYLISYLVVRALLINLPTHTSDISNVRVVGNELAAVAGARYGRRVLVEQIHLLKRQTLRLRDAEVREDDTAQAGRSPNEEHLDLKACVAGIRIDEVRGRKRDRPVPEPV